MALDEIDRESALVSAHDLRLALTRLEGARHSIAMAAAGSDLCDATDAIVPIQAIMVYIATKIAVAEAEAMVMAPKLRVVQGGKR